MENEPPTKQPDHSEIERLKSLVIVNTGDGKGKSTSAFGVIFRALGRDWDTAVIQFLKSGKWKTGETAMAKKLGVDWWEIGEGFTWDSDDLDEDQAIALEAWKQACEVIENGRHRLLVLDEITYPINWGWIPEDEVIDAVRNRPENTNIILTGRDASDSLIKLSDTVTEMKKVKHVYDKGVLAKKGIDY